VNGVVDLQIELFFGERNRQYFSQSMTHPRGIVEPHRDARVHLAQLGQHRAQQLGQTRMPRRHRLRRFGIEPSHLAEMQTVGLATLIDNAKPLPPHAREPEKAVLQLMEIGDLGHGADRVDFGVAGADLPAFTNQDDAEALALAHTAAHHIEITCFKDPQRQRTFGKQYDVERE